MKNISEIIIQTIKEYKNEYGVTPYNINNGYCDQFANHVIIKMGGYSNDLFAIGDDNIFNYRDPEFALNNWNGDLIVTNHAVWSKNSLDKFGYPVIDLSLINDEISHVWIYYNGKHYDAEASNGVNNWFELPICKRFFKKYQQ